MKEMLFPDIGKTFVIGQGEMAFIAKFIRAEFSFFGETIYVFDLGDGVVYSTENLAEIHVDNSHLR